MAIVAWTGIEVRAMRLGALRITQKDFAQLLGFTESVVRKWETRGATITLAGQYAAAMDTVYERLDEAQRERFAALIDDGPDFLAEDPCASMIADRLPELRRALDSHDVPADGIVRSIELLDAAVAGIVDDRLNSNYLRLSYALPPLLDELHRALAEVRGPGRERVCALLAQTYRAADAIADKFGYFDLSARIIGMMQDVAQRSGDRLLVAASAYVRGETFFASGDYEAGRRMLQNVSETIDVERSVRAAAVYGSLHMRSAILAGLNRRPQDARESLDEAERAARRVPEGVYLGTAFGSASVRVHRLSLAVEVGDIGAALREAHEWKPPARSMPAERQSHFYIDLARAFVLTSDTAKAKEALRFARVIAPEHANSHPMVKTMSAQLAASR